MLFNFFSDNHDNKFNKALNAPEIFGSTFTHYKTIACENMIFYFYAVGGKNNYKSYGSVFVHCEGVGDWMCQLIIYYFGCIVDLVVLLVYYSDCVDR